MHNSLLTPIALGFLLLVAVPAVGAHNSPFILTTPSYKITIWVMCEEGVVDCADVEYLGVNIKTGAAIKLKGEDWIRYCIDDQGDGPGKTPCQHLGYKFKNGSTTYYVGEPDGDIEVYQANERILHEKGEWNWGP
jgi:hypothetical protein